MDKATFRKIFVQERAREPEKHAKSLQILDILKNSESYRNARSVLFYLGIAQEVETLPLVEEELGTTARTVVIPFCREGELQLTVMHAISELATGAFGLLELDSRLRTAADRLVSPEEIDLIIIPGVAFDRTGNRIGYGKGYYDKLLPKLRAETVRIGLAFHCQVAERILSEPHDQPLDVIITERELIETGARRC